MTDPFPGGSPFGGFDPRMFENVPLFRELAKVMSWRGGPVNWDLATQTAIAIAAPSGQERTLERNTAELAQAVGAAELWLDQVTALPAVDGPVRALTREQWVRLANSSDGLGMYVEPVAQGMGSALTKGIPEEMRAMAGPLQEAMGAMGAMLYGVQVGTVAGHLAGQLLGTYDLGLPTVEPRTVGTVGDGAARFAQDYGLEGPQVRYWLALVEAAHRRQFAGVPWLRPHVAELIRQFAAEADFDPNAMLEQFGTMGLGPGTGGGEDPFDPAALQEALEGPDAFRMVPSGRQRAVLDRLQALVAFLQAWTDVVVRAAAGGKLTLLPHIEETVRRRRAEKGPGERFLEQLLGLDLKPADFRLGQSFCEAVIAARGQEGLDRAWQRPEHLPTGAELAEPSRWLVRMAAVELDSGSDPG